MQLGATAFKRRLLRRAGWAVVNVNVGSEAGRALRSPPARREWLREAVAAAEEERRRDDEEEAWRAPGPVPVVAPGGE